MRLPVLRVVGPHSGAHRGPDDHQQFPEPYWGENGPVAPLNDSIQPQGQQHGEQQQAGVDQELTAATKRGNITDERHQRTIRLIRFYFKNNGL